MPLQSGRSGRAFGHNVKVEMKAGKPQNQAVAIAYAQKRRSAADQLAQAIEAGRSEAEHQQKATEALHEAVGLKRIV
jgi:hypothetical protein